MSRHIHVQANELFDQIRKEGLVIPYRCPSCKGTLKITGDRSQETSPYCDSDLDMDTLTGLVNLFGGSSGSTIAILEHRGVEFWRISLYPPPGVDQDNTNRHKSGNDDDRYDDYYKQDPEQGVAALRGWWCHDLI